MVSKYLKFFGWLLLILTSAVNAKVNVIGLSVWSGYPENVAGFKAVLTEAGFIEGKHVQYIYRNAGANKTKQLLIAQEFAKKKVDMVYSLTTPGTTIIKATLPEETPIVFSIVTYPADSGLIESFEYSGNNLVGTSNFVPLQSYVKLLTSMLPKAKKVAIFHRKGEPNSNIQTINMVRLFKRAGIEALNVAVSSCDELDKLALSLSEQVDAFITTTDTLMQSGGELRLIAIAKQKNIPILSSNKQGIVDGSTFGPVADFNTLGRISGKMAVQILKGQAQPSSLQSKLQESPIIVINKTSLEQLKISIPNTVKNISYVK